MSSFVNFGSDNPFNLKVGLGKSYKFIFDDQTAFDNFNFLNYGSHIVDKSYPNITLTITPFGPLNFSYTTEHKMGSVDVSEDCQDCDNFQYEVFISNDDINENNVEKYIKDCGASEYSTSNIKILVLKDYGNGYKNYLISYCCDLSLDVSSDYCTVRWDLNITVDCSTSQYTVPAQGISISAPSMSCQPATANFDSWQCSPDLNKIVYYAKSDLCYKGCSSSDIPGSLLIPPQAPTVSEIDSLLPSSQTPTPSYSGSGIPFSNTLPDNDKVLNSIKKTISSSDPSSVNITETNELDQTAPVFEKNISYSSQVLAGDKPHNAKYCHFLGHSTVLTKPNSTDLSDRVFYRETKDGYFYQFDSYLHKAIDNNFLNINGSDVFFINESDSDLNSLPKNMYATSPRQYSSFGANPKTVSSFISVADFTSNPDPVAEPSPQLIEDQSLFQKIYYDTRLNIPIDSSSLFLNWSYWLFELPKKVYGSDAWWENLEQEYFPSFEIIEDSNNYSYNSYSFSNDIKKVYFSHTNNNPNIEAISIVKNKLDRIDDHLYTFTYTDPVFNVSHNVYSNKRNIKIKYHFSPKQNLISSNYQNINLPIERVEDLKFFPQNIFYDSSLDNFAFDYAVDKTLGVINPKHKLIQGIGTRMFDS
jgi:hypothetical protein